MFEFRFFFSFFIVIVKNRKRMIEKRKRVMRERDMGKRIGECDKEEEKIRERETEIYHL